MSQDVFDAINSTYFAREWNYKSDISDLPLTGTAKPLVF